MTPTPLYMIVSDSSGIREVFGPFQSEADIDRAVENVQAGKVVGLPRDCKFFQLDMSHPDTLLNVSV